MLHRPLIDAQRWDAHADADTSGGPPRVRSIAEGLDRTSLGRGHIVGQSAAWKEVLASATQVAATQATVLLQGDSGTGKEVVARFIHRSSPRKDGPFVAINCAAGDTPRVGVVRVRARRVHRGPAQQGRPD